MTRTRRNVLRGVGFLTAGGLLAGCSGTGDGTDGTGSPDGGADGDTTTSPGTTHETDTTSDGPGSDETETTSSEMSTPTVQVRTHPEYGDILVDGAGMTLYLFTNDSPGESVCTGDCASAWPPLTDENPRAGDGVTADLETIEREDGSTQVTADGWPLYYYQGDSAQGDATGQGVGDVWYVVSPAGDAIGTGASTTTRTATPMPAGPTVRATSHPDLGEILADGDGRVLYVFTQDATDESVCTDSCAENWPPLTGANPQAGESVSVDLGTLERPDGSTQVSAAGRPLYYFAGDDGPGQANGQGIGDVWYVLRPDGSLVRSATTATDASTETATTRTPTPTTTTTTSGSDGGGGYY